MNNTKLFLRPKITKIFLSLNTNKGYYPRLYIDIDCPVCTIFKVLNKFKEVGFITISKVGGRREIKLTKKGKKIANGLMDLEKLLK